MIFQKIFRNAIWSLQSRSSAWRARSCRILDSGLDVRICRRQRVRAHGVRATRSGLVYSCQSHMQLTSTDLYAKALLYKTRAMRPMQRLTQYPMAHCCSSNIASQDHNMQSSQSLVSSYNNTKTIVHNIVLIMLIIIDDSYAALTDLTRDALVPFN